MEPVLDFATVDDADRPTNRWGQPRRMFPRRLGLQFIQRPFGTLSRNPRHLETVRLSPPVLIFISSSLLISQVQ